MSLLYAYLAGIITLLVGAGLGWLARDRVGAATGEPTVRLRQQHGGWEEMAVGAQTKGEELIP